MSCGWFSTNCDRGSKGNVSHLIILDGLCFLKQCLSIKRGQLRCEFVSTNFNRLNTISVNTWKASNRPRPSRQLDTSYLKRHLVSLSCSSNEERLYAKRWSWSRTRHPTPTSCIDWLNATSSSWKGPRMKRRMVTHCCKILPQLRHLIRL